MQESINVVWKEAKAPFAKGTTRGLEYSVEKYGEVLKLDDEHPESLGRSAYALAELVTTRGERDLDDQLKKTLELAKKYASDESTTIAAQVLYDVYQGKVDEALKLAEEEENDKKEEVDARVVAAKGRALVAKGQMEQAEALAKKLEKSQNPTNLAFAGHVFRRVGQPDAARVAFDTALKLEPDHDPARAERALLILEQKDLDNLAVALNDVSHLVDLGKDNVGKIQRGYAILGRAEFKRLGNKKDEAARDFEAAKKELFKDPQVLYFYARWQDQQGDSKGMLESLEKASKLDPHRLAIWEAYIGELARKRKYSEAQSVLAKARAVFPSHPDLLTVEVELLGRQKKLDAAEKLIRQKMAAGELPEHHRELGRILLMQKEYGKAIKALETAAEKGKKSSKLTKASIHTLLGRSYARDEKEDKAIEAFSEAIKISRSYAPAYYYLGKSLKATGKERAAKEAFAQAHKIDPASDVGEAAKRQMDAL